MRAQGCWALSSVVDGRAPVHFARRAPSPTGEAHLADRGHALCLSKSCAKNLGLEMMPERWPEILWSRRPAGLGEILGGD